MKAHDSTYTKYPEQVNPRRQRADGWLLGAGGSGEPLVTAGYRTFFGAMKLSWNLIEVGVAEHWEGTKRHWIVLLND